MPEYVIAEQINRFILWGFFMFFWSMMVDIYLEGRSKLMLYILGLTYTLMAAHTHWDFITKYIPFI